MESDRPQEETQLLNTLAEVMPLAREIAPGQRAAFFCAVRQWLRNRTEEESRATSIFRPDDLQTLRQLVAALPWNSEEEIRRKVEGLQLPAPECDLEAANWAFRHQSAAGDLLVGDELVSFRLVRLQPALYVLLAAGERPEIISGFNAVFDREPVLCSGAALRTEGETWTGWVWETSGDAASSQAALRRIRAIWEASGA
jgi:hypothetical protein